MTGMLLDASSTVVITAIAFAISQSTPPTPTRDEEIAHGIAVIALLIIACFLNAGSNALQHGLACSHSPTQDSTRIATKILQAHIRRTLTQRQRTTVS